MCIPAWAIVTISVVLIGIPLAWVIQRKLLARQPMNFRSYSEAGLTDFLTSHFSIGATPPFAVQQFLHRQNIQFMCAVEPELTKKLENVELYIVCSVSASPPSRRILQWIYDWEYQIQFQFLDFKLANIVVTRYSDGYDLFGS